MWKDELFVKNVNATIEGFMKADSEEEKISWANQLTRLIAAAISVGQRGSGTHGCEGAPEGNTGTGKASNEKESGPRQEGGS